MRKYTTIQLAREFKIHPNTIRLYEKIDFLPEIPRKTNGYREFNQFHYEQLNLIRIGLRSELLQNGLRKQIIDIIKASAKGQFELALRLCEEHMQSILKEQKNAEESIRIVKDKLIHEKEFNGKTWTRKQLAFEYDLTIDTLRNWELNGLLKIKRKENGYRVYTEGDVKIIKIIRALRCSNFSLSSILRLLQKLEKNESIDIKETIDTPQNNEDIVSACDKLLTSLNNAKEECKKMIKQIKKTNPPL